MEASQVIGPHVRPFWGRIAVIDSPVDEDERESGLIVPAKFDGDEGVVRGIVADADRTDEETRPWLDQLHDGTVVYYDRHAGRRVGELRIVAPSEILAFEAS